MIVPQLVQKKNAAGEELQNAETQYRACQKEAAQAKADYQELLGGAAAAEQIAVHTAKEIEQAEKRTGCLYGKGRNPCDGKGRRRIQCLHTEN